jgi:Ca-activated chloride channel family protein
MDRSGELRQRAHTSTRIVFARRLVLLTLCASSGCQPASPRAAVEHTSAARQRRAHVSAGPAVEVAKAGDKDESSTPEPALDARATDRDLQPLPAAGTPQEQAEAVAQAEPTRTAPSDGLRRLRSSKGKLELYALDDSLAAPAPPAHPNFNGSGLGAGALRAAPVSKRLAAPGAEFNTEAYAHNPDNAVQHVADSPLSTFSIDVDTASYSNVRRFLRAGQRPPIDAVRIEELINYFRYEYPAPTGPAPFSVATEVASAPWNPQHRLVQIGLRAREIPQTEVPARNLVFLVDVSGSMQSEDKLPLLKRGLTMLIRQLRPQDRIAMAVYAGASGLALPSTSGKEQQRILAALEALEAGGSTNGADGIELAYRVATQQFIQGGVNRVILATDGDFNVGVTSQGELVRLIEEKRKSGVFLTVLGFGDGNLKDSTMEMLADKGNGHYAYIDSIAEAHKVLVRESGSTLVTVAKDVKLQVEWNPAQVASYRLLGYENRVLADRDFNDDKKDAGDIGAGHTVTALYEVELAASALRDSGKVDPLKYQAARALTGAADSGELLTIKLRYKRPDADTSALLSTAVRDFGKRIEDSSTDMRWAAAVAGFGMLLRHSDQRGTDSLQLVQTLAHSALGADPNGDRKEFLELVQRVGSLGIDG